MEGLYLILVMSLVTVSLVILFAVFPIKLRWFFKTTGKPAARRRKRQDDEYKSVFTFDSQDWDDYDDKEL